MRRGGRLRRGGRGRARAGGGSGPHTWLERTEIRGVLRLRLAREVVVGYAHVRTLVARHEVAHVVETLRGEVEPVAGGPDAVALGRRLGRPIRRALDPLPWDSRCLMRSLVLLRMLSARGVGAQLVIGVRPDGGGGGKLAAHAWLEHDGAPLLPTLGYAELTRL